MIKYRLKIAIRGDGLKTVWVELEGDNTYKAHSDADFLIRKYAYQGFIQHNSRFIPWHEVESLTVEGYHNE